MGPDGLSGAGQSHRGCLHWARRRRSVIARIFRRTGGRAGCLYASSHCLSNPDARRSGVPQIARRARRRERSGVPGLPDGGAGRVARARVHRARRRGGPRVRIRLPPSGESSANLTSLWGLSVIRQGSLERSMTARPELLTAIIRDLAATVAEITLRLSTLSLRTPHPINARTAA
jgi:hypothetical protein